MGEKKITLSSVLSCNEFRNQVLLEIEHQNYLHKKAIIKFGRLKRAPIDRLKDRNVFDETIVLLYDKILGKELKGYSRAERDYIKKIGDVAFLRTLKILNINVNVK